MSIKKEKIPIVRFRDFSEPWLKKLLSEVAEFSKGRGYSKKDLQSHGTPIIYMVVFIRIMSQRLVMLKLMLIWRKNQL